MISGGFSRGNPNSHWHSIDTITDGPLAPQSSFAATQAWVQTDLAIYIPVIVRSRVVVRKLWYANATTATGNYDIGLYDAAGTALLRKGSTAKTTTTEEIVWDCSDTALDPGIYYLALSASNASDTYTGSTRTAPYPAAVGIHTQTSAFPLPATATFAVAQTLAWVPIIGMFLNTLAS